MDRLQSLRIFVAIAETESFAAGARAFGLSAPSATRAVNILEESLGTRLFTRTTRRVRLTEVGQAYLHDVREALAALQVADETASGAAQAPIGELRITCPQEFGRIYVVPILMEFLDLHPQITAELLLIDRVVNLVEEGFDVAVRIGPLPASTAAALQVGKVRRVLCAAPVYFSQHGYPQKPADLTFHRPIAVGSIASGAQWRLGKNGEATIRLKPRLSVSSISAAIEAARRGWGLCQALSYQIASDLDAGTLQTVLEHWEPEELPIHLVHIEGRRAAPKVRAFVDFAATRLRQMQPTFGTP